MFFTQNRFFCFYFLTLPFYFVPSLGNNILEAYWPRSVHYPEENSRIVNALTVSILLPPDRSVESALFMH